MNDFINTSENFNITLGVLSNSLQYYIGGEGSSETPKSYYVIYGQPHTTIKRLNFNTTIKKVKCENHQEKGWAEKADYAECLGLITSLQLKGTEEVRNEDQSISQYLNILISQWINISIY